VMTDQPGNFVDDNHALRAGMFVGLLIKHGIIAAPWTDDDGNYTDVVHVEYHDLSLGDIEFRVRVLP
jgi:hypothetical protein